MAAQDGADNPLIEKDPESCASCALYSHSDRPGRVYLADGPRLRPPLCLWILQFLFLILSLSILVYALRHIRSIPQNCVEKLSMYSPALEAVSDDYVVRRINASVYGFSPYKGEPADEKVHAAWKGLSLATVLSISHETLLAIGAPESSVRLPPERGGGYMATLEMPHQLHCLEVLWKSGWSSHWDPDQDNATSLYHLHLDHCMEIIRQKLLCDADAGILTYSWVKHVSHPTPNFNMLRKCRDSESLLDWMWQHESPHARDGPLTKPEDAIELEDFP